MALTKVHSRMLNGETVDVKSFGAKGDNTTDDTDAIQAAIDYVSGIGGGDVIIGNNKITDQITIKSSNIRIIGKYGAKLTQAGAIYDTFVVYPESLQDVVDGTDRPSGFPNGINGEGQETLFYEATDSSRLRNVAFININYSFTGASNSGRFVSAYSVDSLEVSGCKIASPQNGVNLYYCRDALVENCSITCTTAHNGFNIFMLKAYGQVRGCDLVDGNICVDAKGCYPQEGKGVTEAFDSGYNFYHPIVLDGNRMTGFGLHGCSAGYYNNSGDDISATPVGTTKKDWFGEVWGWKVTNNTFQSTSAAVGRAGAETNINSKYAKITSNTFYGCGYYSHASTGIEFSGNVIIEPNQTSTSPIEITGGTFGADSENSEGIRILDNTIYDQVNTGATIRIRGGDFCDVIGNKCINSGSGSDTIRVDSSLSATTSENNRVINNVVSKTAADFQYAIKSTGANYTIIDKNFGYGGFYNGNALDSNGSTDNHYKRGVVSADTPTSYVGSAGTSYVGQNFGDQNATTSVTGYADEMSVNGMVGGGWRQAVRFGEYFLWVDSTGDLRIKATKPTSDTDGTVVGSQS